MENLSSKIVFYYFLLIFSFYKTNGQNEIITQQGDTKINFNITEIDFTKDKFIVTIDFTNNSCNSIELFKFFNYSQLKNENSFWINFKKNNGVDYQDCEPIRSSVILKNNEELKVLNSGQSYRVTLNLFYMYKDLPSFFNNNYVKLEVEAKVFIKKNNKTFLINPKSNSTLLHL